MLRVQIDNNDTAARRRRCSDELSAASASAAAAYPSPPRARGQLMSRRGPRPPGAADAPEYGLTSFHAPSPSLATDLEFATHTLLSRAHATGGSRVDAVDLLAQEGRLVTARPAPRRAVACLESRDSGAIIGVAGSDGRVVRRPRRRRDVRGDSAVPLRRGGGDGVALHRAGSRPEKRCAARRHARLHRGRRADRVSGSASPLAQPWQPPVRPQGPPPKAPPTKDRALAILERYVVARDGSPELTKQGLEASLIGLMVHARLPPPPTRSRPDGGRRSCSSASSVATQTPSPGRAGARRRRRR